MMRVILQTDPTSVLECRRSVFCNLITGTGAKNSKLNRIVFFFLTFPYKIMKTTDARIGVLSYLHETFLFFLHILRQ